LSELTGNRIRTTAAKLGLPHLAEAINEYTRRADEAKMSSLGFLDLVLSEELSVRDDRRFRQDLRLSKLPHHKTLDDYDFSFQPELGPRKVKDLATLSFVDAKDNAALLGPPGVGKTHPHRRRPRGRGLPGRLLDLLHEPRRHDPQPQGCGNGRTAGQQARHLPTAQRPGCR
jgi:hypothetical protein